eukprot:8531107-Ditylum_brightwellii.AAC.1
MGTACVYLFNVSFAGCRTYYNGKLRKLHSRTRDCDVYKEGEPGYILGKGKVDSDRNGYKPA